MKDAVGTGRRCSPDTNGLTVFVVSSVNVSLNILNDSRKPTSRYPDKEEHRLSANSSWREMNTTHDDPQSVARVKYGSRL